VEGTIEEEEKNPRRQAEACATGEDLKFGHYQFEDYSIR
jgi:hypothetical protein